MSWTNDIPYGPPRGVPSDSFFTGGWRCAAAMGFFGHDIPDHLVTAPAWRADNIDIRHGLYCRACAEKYLGEKYEP